MLPNHHAVPTDGERNFQPLASLTPPTAAAGPDIDPDQQVVEQEDGSALVLPPHPEKEEQGAAQDFHANLVEAMDPRDADLFAADLIDDIKRDQKTRSRRDELYAEGLRRTGLGEDAPGGAEFEGASKVVHPVLAEACVDFEARAIKELFPPGGPVKTQLTGVKDQQRTQLAEQKRDGLNWMLTKGIPEYKAELEQTLSQVPMGGSQFMKLRPDLKAKRIRVEFVPIDDVFISFSASNFYTAPRATHRQWVTRLEWDQRVASGLYTDLTDKSEPHSLDTSEAGEANNRIEGKDQDAYNEDGLREVYETYLWTTVEADTLAGGAVAPYIAHIDKHTEQLVGLYRNWQEGDDTLEKLDWIVEWGMIPWRGAYKLGLMHLIGSLSAAATGTLRALLDSAMIANAPTLLKLARGRVVGQTTDIALTQVQEIEGPPGVEDIRQLVMPVPFAGPNPVLFQLLGFTVDAAKGVVTTSEEKIADASNQMPVGTSMALIEQGSKVFASIHARLHDSQAKMLQIICRLLATYPELLAPMAKALGPAAPPAQLFQGTDDIAPVSDPNIFSEAQRFAQLQAVLQMQGADAQDPSIPWNKVELRRRGLQLLNYPDPDGVLPPLPTPKTLNPVAENLTVTHGGQVIPGPQQDHIAHVYTHLAFLENPLLGANQLALPKWGPPLIKHIQDHMAMYYAMQMAQLGGMQPQDNPQMDQQMAQAAEQLNKEMATTFADLHPRIGRLLQALQQLQPPPPADPAQLSYQAAMAETQRKQQADQNANNQKMAAQQNEARAIASGEQQLSAKNLQGLRELLLQLAQKTDQQEKDRALAYAQLLAQMGDPTAGPSAEVGQQRAASESDVPTTGAVYAQLEQLISDQAEQQTQDAVAPLQQAQDQHAQQLSALQELIAHHTATQQQHGEALQQLMGGMQHLIQQGQRRPNKIVRDANGDAVGMTYDPALDQGG